MRDALTRKQRKGSAVERAPARSAPRALRLFRRGRPPGEVWLDPAQSYAIGRGAQGDLCFDDENVSRLHAHLKHEPSGWVLVDARSANGTFVAAGVALHADPPSEETRARLFASARLLPPGEPRTLEVGDVVFFGDAHAALHAVSDVATAPRTATPASERGRRYLHDLERAARARGPVLLIGRSGVGKTWAAHQLHEQSGRSGAFVALNAAALPHDPTQLRSVLLGHVKGAFTGASSDVVGAWATADGGTLFLDEVDSLAEPAQAFLLTLIEQSGDLTPLGAPHKNRARPLDVRLVAATKTSLAHAQLREDLAYRLVDGSIVEIPSLQDRRADIPALVQELLAAVRAEDGASAPFDEGAVSACARADWPGEIRQLRGVVRLLSREALAEGRGHVTAADVTTRLSALSRALGSREDVAAAAPTTGASTKKPRELTKEDVLHALAEERDNMQRAAARLGVARNTLLSKMDTFGIPRPTRR